MKRSLKIILTLFLLLVVIIIIAASIFVLTFDPNRYKEPIIQNLETAIQKNIQIGNISLNIIPNLSLRLDGVSVKEMDKAWEQAFLKVSSLDVSIKLLPLMRKDIQLDHLSIRGLDLEITKKLLMEYQPKSNISNSANINIAQASSAALKFLAKSITITDSSIQYIDNISEKKMDVRIDIIEATLKNISVYGPCDIEAEMALFGSPAKNIKIMALLYPEIQNKQPYLKNLDVEIDLSKLNLHNAMDSIGEFKSQVKEFISTDLAGNLSITSPKIYLMPEKILESTFVISLLNSNFELIPIKNNIKNIELKAEYQVHDIIISKLACEIEGLNLASKGTIKEILSEDRYIKDLELVLKLNNFNMHKLLKDLTQDKINIEQFIGKSISGDLTLDSKIVYLRPEKIKSSLVDVNFSNGTVDILALKDTAKNIELKAIIEKGDIALEKFSGNVLDGSLDVKGTSKAFLSANPVTNIEAEIKALNLKKILPEAKPSMPSFEGIASLDISSALSGAKPEDIMNSLKAQGKLHLKNAILKNMNILRIAFEKLSMVPGLVNRLQENLPNNYKELLKQNDTAFEPIDASFNIENKILSFKDVVIESEALYLIGEGNIDFDRNIRIKSHLFIPKELSYAFASVVPELQYLEDDQGMITMPLSIGGSFPDNISVTPDLEYVIQKLAISKGQELLQNIIRKAIPTEGQEKGSEPTTKGEGQQETDKTGKQPKDAKHGDLLLKTIFDIITSPEQKKQ